MSIRIMAWARSVEAGKLATLERLVLITLADGADYDGYASVNLNNLACRCETSLGSAITALRKLEEAKLIKQQAFGDGRGSYRLRADG